MTGRKKGPITPIVERYQYEAGRRASVEGRALAALGGDVAAIRELADLGQLILAGVEDGHAAKSPELREAAGWLAFILADIVRGKSPDEAFGLRRPGKAGAREDNFETLERKHALIRDARRLAEQLRGISVDAAQAVVRQFWPDADILDMSKPWGCEVNRATTKVSVDSARRISAHLIAAHHRANDPATKWGRYGTGKFRRLEAATILDHMTDKHSRTE